MNRTVPGFPEKGLSRQEILAAMEEALCVTAVTWFYPLTRERHARIHRLLQQQKEGTTTLKRNLENQAQSKHDQQHQHNFPEECRV